MAKLEGNPVAGGTQVTTATLDQLVDVLAPEGYTALTITAEGDESVFDVVALLGYVYPGQALEIDGRSVMFSASPKIPKFEPKENSQ